MVININKIRQTDSRVIGNNVIELRLCGIDLEVGLILKGKSVLSLS